MTMIAERCLREHMLPPEAQKRMQAWIRSRHLIRAGNFFMFETVEYSTIEKFQECVQALGGSLISVEPTKKIWIGNHRRVMLYQAKASLHTPHHDLVQYWIKYGSFHTRFDERE
jgi:phycoerythrin-associated linker protein